MNKATLKVVDIGFPNYNASASEPISKDDPEMPTVAADGCASHKGRKSRVYIRRKMYVNPKRFFPPHTATHPPTLPPSLFSPSYTC